MLKTADAKNLQFVKSQAAAALKFLAEGERDVLFVSQSPATRGYVGLLDGTVNESSKTVLLSQLKLFLTDNPVYLGVRILDNSGQEVLGIDNINGRPTAIPDTALEKQGDQPYYIEAFRLLDQVYISDVDLNSSHKKIEFPYVPIIRFSIPLYSEDGGIVGIIALKALASPMLKSNIALDSDAAFYIVDDEGNYLSNPDPDKLYGNLLKTGSTFDKDQPRDSHLIREQSEGTFFSSQDRPDALQAFVSVTVPNRDDLHWTFIYQEKLSKVLSQINNARLVIITLASGALLIALSFAWFITRNIVQPVQQLAKSSAAISRGEWEVPIPIVKGGDEISKLAEAFSHMSRELKALYEGLEMRVIARTSELETVAKVSAAAAAILDIDRLLKTISELTKTNFDLYHAQVYLLDDTGTSLILAASPGETDQELLMQRRTIPLATEISIVARAARGGHGIIVNNANFEAPFLSNQLLPHTHSEMAVPLIVANKLLGVLDLQSDQINRFAEADLRVMGILGDQIAVALQNAYLYKNQLQTAAELAIAQQRAEQANKAKSLFLSNMSHELRTPLNIVIGYTSAMLDRPTMYDNVPLPPVYAKDIRLIKENGYHLIGLINDILDLSKIEAGKLELQCAPTNLIDIFRGVFATSVGLVKDKPIQIRADFPDQLPIVWADATRVRQIILNLMANAIKFTDRGSVTLSARAEDRGVKISVSDTGIGIPEKALAHIFDRFQQANQDTSKYYGGTGLGLDISKQLCEMHGDNLTVESVFGQGSIFSFALPLVHGQDAVSSTVPEPSISTSRLFSSNIPVTLAPTVMLIDSDISTCDLIRQSLQSLEAIVISTNAGANAFDMALGMLPDVIVLDVQLPTTNGWHILKALKENLETCSIPVIVCGSAADQDRALSDNAALYVTKPIDPQHILSAIKAVQPRAYVPHHD
ncbi:MAG: ATP-binding protein [Chloroflexota bacterium]